MKKIIMLSTIFALLLTLSGCGLFSDKDNNDDFVALDLDKALMIVSNNELYGLVDLEGNIVVPIQYDDMFYSGSYYVGVGNYSFTIYNELGEEVISINDVDYGYYNIYFGPEDFSPLDEDALIPYVASSNLYGYMNYDGEKIIPTQYDLAIPFNEDGLALVMIDNQYGFINKDGEVVIDISYYDTQTFSEGLVAMEKNGSWGFMDTEGNIVIGFEYDGVSSFYNGISYVNKNGKAGIIDTEGNYIMDLIYDQIITSENSDGFIVYKDGYYGYADSNGDILIGFEYSLIYEFTENDVAIASKDGLKGLIDKSGNTLIDFNYNNIFWMGEDNNYLSVQDGYKYAIFDNKGNMILGFEFDFIGGLTNDVFVFSEVIEGSVHEIAYGLAGIDGNIIVEAQYDAIYNETSGLHLVQNGDKYGFINNEGTIIVALDYDYVYPFGESQLAAVNIGDKWGFINTSGDIVIPIIYDEVVTR